MRNIERAGINKRWSSRWKAERKNRIEWIASFSPQTVEFLEFYAAHGTQIEKPIDTNPIPFKMWEIVLPDYINMYGLLRNAEVEVCGLDGSPFDAVKAANAFASFYTAEIIQLSVHSTSQELRGRQFRNLTMFGAMASALGMVIGTREHAERLARMQIAAFRRGWFYDRELYPIHNFVLRLLADFLGEPALEVIGLSAEDPVFNALYESWSTPDPEHLVPICLAACDAHTNSCNDSGDEDFSSGEWRRTPIEILLVNKLRQLRGLSNPRVDHPLMNTPLGVLPDEVAFQPDQLIHTVRNRMTMDGYDENEIETRVMKGR